MSRRGDAAAAVANLGSVQSGSFVDYRVSVAGTEQVRKIRVDTTAKDYRLYDIVEIPHLVLSLDPNQVDDDYKSRPGLARSVPSGDQQSSLPSTSKG